MNSAVYPELINSLPEVELPVDSVVGKLLQGKDRQVVFFEMQEGTSVPLHTHGAQWGIVVEGKMELTIGDDTRMYTCGDSYFIPAGVLHGATFLTYTRAIDVFAESDRYNVKQK